MWIQVPAAVLGCTNLLRGLIEINAIDLDHDITDAWASFLGAAAFLQLSFADDKTGIYLAFCQSAPSIIRGHVRWSVCLLVRLSVHSCVICEQRIWPFPQIKSHQMKSKLMIQ